MQDQLKKEQEGSEKKSGLREAFEGIKNEETHKTLNLLYKNCCGCGCNNTNLQRIVPADSKLKNGDYVDDIEADDIVL